MNPRIALALFFALAGLLGGAPASAQKIVLNEIFRGSDFGPSGDEWVELVLLEDLSAAELEGWFVGDSDLNGLGEKAASLRFADMGSIAPSFGAGTVIVVAGGGPFPDGLEVGEDLSYDFAGGDRSITLDANGAHLVRRGALDFSIREIAWIDAADGPAPLSAEGFAVRWGAVDAGSALGAAAQAAIPSPPNGGPGSSALLEGPALAGDGANWSVTDPPAPGLGNGGANSAAIAALPVELSAWALE